MDKSQAAITLVMFLSPFVGAIVGSVLCRKKCPFEGAGYGAIAGLVTPTVLGIVGLFIAIIVRCIQVLLS